MPKKAKTTKTKRTKVEKESFSQKIQDQTAEGPQSYLNLILGGLIVVVLAVLLFNYFNKPKGDVGTGSQMTQATSSPEAVADVAKENLPGKYTVKEGDTLYTIAQNYYGDGFMYNQIVSDNKIGDENILEVGQVLDIPKSQQANQPTASLSADTSATDATTTNPTEMVEGGTGGATNQTEWGEKISGDTYTVTVGDWLSKIAGRAYGDIYSFDKIAKANNLTDPNVIEPGTVLKIPR